jgi:hypothetical protein
LSVNPLRVAVQADVFRNFDRFTWLVIVNGAVRFHRLFTFER